jgi:hypothetical protein
MSIAGRVTAEKLDAVQNLTERADFLTINTGGAHAAACC